MLTCMIDRRDLLGLVAVLAGSQELDAQPAGVPRSGPIFTGDLPELHLKGWAVTVVEVAYAPGQGSSAHRHPGITIAYVLEGEIASQVGEGAEKVFKTGDLFMETPNQLHGVSRNASKTKPARLLAVLLAEKGKPLTSPA